MLNHRFLLLLPVIALIACSDQSTSPDSGSDVDDTKDSDATDVTDTTDATDATDVTPPKVWETNYEPHKEKRGNVTILWLKGTPYEMGLQHGELMAEELAKGVEYIQGSELGLLEVFSREFGFLDDAKVQSYDMILDECEGMAEGAKVEGWTLDLCLALAYGEVFLDHLELGILDQCSQFLAAGPAVASEDGELIHGRNLDWDDISYLLEYPTIIVRHPTGKIPYVTVGFPGNVATYNGINAAGISVASNENQSNGDIDRVGTPSIQTQNVILAEYDNIDDIMAMIEGLDRMSAENLVIADGNAGRGVIYQLTASHFGKNELGDAGIGWITNHYTHPDMVKWGIEYKENASTLIRHQRLTQLLDPEEKETTLYGKIDVPKAVSVLRDRYNPQTGETQPEDAFDDDSSIATNGVIYSIVFKPKSGHFWLAAGNPPVPLNTYHSYSIAQLFGWDEPNPPTPDKVD